MFVKCTLILDNFFLNDNVVYARVLSYAPAFQTQIWQRL